MATLDELKATLKSAASFPSPPAIARQIIELADDPDYDMARVAAAINKDPGLTAKILRVANSPLYSKRRNSDNLRQATVVLGLNAVTSLALSFSLIGTYKVLKSNCIDYALYWRRTIVGALVARGFGAQKGVGAVEQIFLAALLQDIAMLAIDRVSPDIYRGLPPEATHAQLKAREAETLGLDHAELSAWLLNQWKLPEALCRMVEFSHRPFETDEAHATGVATRCIALGNAVAAALPAAPVDFRELSIHASQWLRFSRAQVAETITHVMREIPEIERLFDTTLMTSAVSGIYLERARELLTAPEVPSAQAADLAAPVAKSRSRTLKAESPDQLDALTGVYTRARLNEVLDREFGAAVEGGWPLSVVAVEPDHFRRINEMHGDSGGDAVLAATARIILAATRESDMVSRYGDEEFMIVLPGIAHDDAEIVCQRLLAHLRAARLTIAGASLKVTASLGLATHSKHQPLNSAAQLVEAAVRAASAAKKLGKDRLVRYTAPRSANPSGGANGG
jgi:diguanylate cyclase (GGDEF)-like protein